jgi:DNA polymerase
MSKKDQLEKIAREITDCRICRRNKSGLPVPGEGNPNAKIMFIGEAPGKTESQTGRPFVGRSGRLLTVLIESIGLAREDVFITSPVKYFPGYRAPSPAEIAHGKTHLDKQIEIIDPGIIVLLGQVAQRGVLGKYLALNGHHAKTVRKNKKLYFLTFHPAAALRFPKIRALLESDFKKLAALL